jgi:hypothetical protein
VPLTETRRTRTHSTEPTHDQGHAKHPDTASDLPDVPLADSRRTSARIAQPGRVSPPIGASTSPL